LPQPPISKTADEAIGWVYFALGFVRAAITQEISLEAEVTIARLRDFVVDGMKMCGLADGPEFQAVFPKDLKASLSKLILVRGQRPVDQPGATS
jgi:hypothetical protein